MPSDSEILDRVRAGRPLDHIPVVDMHCHIGTFSEYYHMPRSRPRQVIAYMDRFGIDHILTFPINVTSDPAPGNRLQYAAARAFPRRISALTMLHAAFPQDWLALIEEGERRGARGVKLISQYQGAPEASVDWTPVFEFGRNKGWIALHHSWGVDRLERWAAQFPEIVFIIGHASLAYKRLLERFDNVYQCTCAAFAVAGSASTQRMLEQLPPEKIVYGSDALDLDFGTAIGPIAYARAPESLKERVLGGNALEIFRRQGIPLPGISGGTGASSPP